MFSLIMLCCSLLLETVNEDKYVGRREIENNTRGVVLKKALNDVGLARKPRVT